MQDREFVRAKPEELWPSHLPQNFKKKIAIYGGGYTRRLIWDHPLVDDDCEIWTGNHAWNKQGWGEDCPRIDRCFDVHLVDQLEAYTGEGDMAHFEWLQTEHPFPIYMQDPDGRFPSAVRYPYDEIVQEFFSKQYRGSEVKAAFGSTIDFITAMAIQEGADWIGYFGIEMGSSTEHTYQIPAGHVWIGICAGRGVTTWVPDDPRVQLLRHQVYAYEGFQLVEPEVLQAHRDNYEDQYQRYLTFAKQPKDSYELLTKQLKKVRTNGGDKNDLRALEEDALALGENMRIARETAAVAKGCKVAVEALLELGHPVVSRQTLENRYYDYEKQRRRWVDSANTWIGGYRRVIGQLTQAHDEGYSEEVIKALEDEAESTGLKVRRAREAAAMASGLMIAVRALIEVTDLKDPDLTIHSNIFAEMKLEEIRP